MTEQERIESIKKNGGMHLQSFKRENITYEMCVLAVTMNGAAITFVPQELLTPDIYRISCRSYGVALRLVPLNLITSEMCIDAVRSATEALDYVPDEYKTPALFLEAALAHPEAMKRIPPEIITPDFCVKVMDKNDISAVDSLPKALKDSAFYLQLVSLRPEVLWKIPRKQRTQAVCQKALDCRWHGSLLEAVKEKPENLSLFPPNMYEHQACLEFVRSSYFHNSLSDGLLPQYNNGYVALGRYCYYEYNMSKLLQWHDVALIVVKYHFGFLHYVPKKTITEELCWEAVRANAEAFRFVPSKFCSRELCMYAFERNKYALENIPEEYVTEEMCDEAVAYNGSALEYVPDKFKTKKLCKKALADKHSICSLFIPEWLMDKELALMCIHHSPFVSLSQIPERLRDAEVCLAAVTNNRQNLQYVPEAILSDDIIKAAVERFGWVPGIPEKYITEELMNFVMERHPWDFSKLPKEYLTRQVCLKALKYRSTISRTREYCLKDIPARFVDAELCAEYIQAKPDCILDIPEQFRTKELLLFSAKEHPYIVESAIPKTLRQDAEFMEAFEKLKAQTL